MFFTFARREDPNNRLGRAIVVAVKEAEAWKKLADYHKLKVKQAKTTWFIGTTNESNFIEVLDPIVVIA